MYTAADRQTVAILTMEGRVRIGTLVTLLLLYNWILLSCAQVLTPPTFNLAKNRKISASATCGVGAPGYRELYCLLTGATGDNNQNSKFMIQGQLCDYCDPNDPVKTHPAENAIDGTERFWQSPPLSRGKEFNEVNLEIELEQEFHIAYVFIRMANSPRPEVWALEKSEDYGKTWKPWQYHAQYDYDCMRFFQKEAKNAPTSDNEVLCVTEFSRIVPLKDGEILVSLTNNRPNFNNFSYADELQDFMRATNVRLKFLRTNTLRGELMTKAQQDATVTRRYYYSIKDISIGGRCLCNGHANTCNYLDPINPNRLICDCQHNTVGDQCEMCDADKGFVQKKWQPRRANSAFVCEPCQCYNRAFECQYDADVDEQKLSIDIHGFYNGGGVCQNCGYNSTGVNCEKCLPGFYRPFGVPVTDLFMCEECVCDPRFHINECEDLTGRCTCRPEFAGLNCESCAVGYYDHPNCKPCDCHINGTIGDICHVNGGQCPCKENYVGIKCDQCQLGYYNFPDCTECSCDNDFGSRDNFCNVEGGQCNCRDNYGSRNCSECADGYYNYPNCDFCSCDPVGTVEEICDKSSGQCLCKDTFDGDTCGQCARGYYAYPSCMACQCQEPGSTSNICGDSDGQCTCKPNYGGQNCERCAPGFYKYPECIACDCDNYGSLGESCSQETGQCDCRNNFQGLKCEKCKEGLYNYPNCEECNCNPAGAKEVPGFPLGGCGEVISGRLCECKERVVGRICDMCKPGYWSLNRNNPLGCEECACSDAGTIAGVNTCDMSSGQCMCKVSVTGRTCDRCRDGYYGLHKQNIYGCVECKCDIGGSVSLACDKETGECNCKPRVEGQRCDQPIRQHYIPTLDQLKYEVEDGYTPEGTQVRFDYDERTFPNFSWRGYAILMKVQPEVRLDINVEKPSLYRLVYRYVNLNEGAVKGEVRLVPESPLDISQSSSVIFEPTRDPEFADVGNDGGLPSFVLNPGRWTVSINADDNVFLDYMILIPQSYYEASVLQNIVYRPCEVANDQGPCIHYGYPVVIDFPRVLGETGYIIDEDGNKITIDLFDNKLILDNLNINSMAVLGPNQKSFNLDLYIPRDDKYVLVLNYYSDSNTTQTVLFDIGEDEQATAVLYSCQYSSLCRQVLLGLDEMEGVFDFKQGWVNITVTGGDDVSAAVESINAIPYSTWSIRYIKPTIICIRVNGVCVRSNYPPPVGSVQVEFEELPNDHLIAHVYPPGIETDEIGLVELNRTLNMIVLLGEARSPGLHKFAVQYYLPYDVGQDIAVTLFANGQEYEGTFRPSYCPGVTGCRDLIYFDKTGTTGNIDLLETDVKIVFNNTSGQQIWLDYLLLIPSGRYTPYDVRILSVDNSKNFIDNCLDEGYVIKTPMSDFCEHSLFTLTTDFNGGALECECNIDGSLSFHCDPNGGQCSCKPNVIGRTCSACRVGYYGFPRCQPCNCPFGLCHQLTGQCICPPRVTGDKCDVCKPGTYGYDALIGCQECLCNEQGTVDGDVNCQAESGQCRCLPGIGGRKCDFCLTGFYGYPFCRGCDCDTFGTTEDICNRDTAQCLCKGNVVGERCDMCDAFTYNMDPINPDGCSKCFCFGMTSNCIESTKVWSLLSDMMGWAITNTVDGSFRDAGTTIALLDAVDKTDNVNQSMYWVAPEPYLGNKISSYGGTLNYKALFVLSRNDSVDTEALVDPDVILVGANNKSIGYTSEDPPMDSQFKDMTVQLFEYDFKWLETGEKVLREDFMMILVDLKAMYIRGSYYSIVEELRLSEVELEVAVDSEDVGKQAVSVEMCQCPRGYSGASCESCADGYYRARDTPYLGICQPCVCNGHASKCDVNTGECLDCANNTIGAHCDMCRPGYYGEPWNGEGCQICGCPLMVDSNNFADQCLVTDDGVVTRCGCFEGYSGDKCDSCSPGYYGNPMEQGDTCKPCQCNNNINTRDPDACDTLTGDCNKCLYNSTGPSCEKCLYWFYGDAIGAKDCTECKCDKCGTVSCNSQYGQCTCKPNVVGLNCDSCAPDTYGFDECSGGCIPCNCGMASLDTQCDANNGSCQCQDGVVGHKCEFCENGYWNYQETGCERCDCEFDGAVTCDPTDGRCQCLPGVTGPKCEDCLDRWVLIPQQGCQECDECTHYLLDDMDTLDEGITEVQSGLQTVSIGVEAMRRLNAANMSVAELEPKLHSVLHDSENITLDPVAAELQMLQVTVNNVMMRTKVSNTDAGDLLVEGKMLADNSIEAEKLGEMSQKDASDAIVHINDVLRQINEGIKVTNIETYIRMSEQIIADIKSVNFTSQNDSIYENIQLSEMLLDEVKEKQLAPQEHMMFKNSISMNIDDIAVRVNDLNNNSAVSEGTSQQALNLISRLNDVTISSIDMHVEEIVMAEKMTIDATMMSKEQLNESESNLNTAEDEFRLLEKVLSETYQGKAAMNQFNTIFDENLQGAAILVNESHVHAEDLRDQAALLENVYTDTRDVAANAVTAGRAYENIVKAIDNAAKAAQDAFNAADSAAIDSTGVGEESSNYTVSSGELLVAATLRFNETQIQLLERLESAKAGTTLMEDMNMNVETAGMNIKDAIARIPTGEAGEKANMVVAKGDNAAMNADDSKNKVAAILDDLPKQLEKTIPLTTDALNTNRDISQAIVQVKNVQKVIPDVKKLLVNITGQSDNVQLLGREVTTNIAALKEKIAIARNQANLIRVGLRFVGNTSVTLRNPPNVEQAGSYSEVSLFFKTSADNGLLLYAGSERSATNKGNQGDYMALEIENGNVVFKYDLGAGETKINHPHYVADGQWYQVIAKRIGKGATLIINQDPKKPQLEPVMGNAEGLSTVLEMNPRTTKFFVGGLPDSSIISDKVTRESYVGVMESIEFDGTPMGLWNFEAAENNLIGARERNILTKTISNGFRFDGSGYVVLSKSATAWSPAVRSQITMSIKTYAEDGLLFFAGDGNRDFISVELKNGRVLYQFDLGGGRISLTSPKVVSDGEWHDIQVNKLERTGAMFVDKELFGPVDAPGTLNQLSITDDISIGGYQDMLLPVDGVTKKGFVGCIKDVSLELIMWDLNDHKQSKGVIPGCPEQIARVATFTSGVPSYLARPIDSIGANFDITFKMKTKQDRALLLFAGNSEQNAGFSVSLVDGKISVISDPGGEKLEMMSRVNTYNDGRWHYISIMKIGKSMQMNIDDYETLQTIGSGSKKSLDTSTPLYFGYADIVIPDNLAGATEQLEGCIGDVTINGEFLNFAVIQPRDRPGTSLAACPIPDPEGPWDREIIPTLEPWVEITPEPTTLPPTLPPGRCALDVIDPLVLSEDDVRGNYFGAQVNSRLEYQSLPSSVRIRSKISMEFKTTNPNGVLFYFADTKHVDHISVVMRNGMVRFTFDSGTGAGELMSTQTYNDGQWHKLMIGRSMREGTMMIDMDEFGPVTSGGRARSINGRPPYYFGGIETSDLPKAAIDNLGGVTSGFVGCIANIKMNDDDIGEPSVLNGTQQCSDLTNNGAYYYGEGGYIKLVDSFNVGLDIEISVELRPRSINGVILSVHGTKGDFIVLQMVEGNMWFTADNGAGSFTAKFKVDMNNKLCDGEWHSITAKKNKNVVTLIVDEFEPVVATSSGSATVTDTNNPIYLGGKPNDITKGIRAKGDYRGCMRNLYINEERQYLTSGIAVNDVDVNACPVN